jgi:TfoX/Sxy family transcriptional regulator of competence genes
MATAKSTVAHILEQAAGAGTVRARAMFGEYALYCDDKVVGLICDDTLFLKATEGALGRVDAPEFGPPYPGAKPHLIADAMLDDPEALVALIRAIWADVPMPKPRKPRKKP